MIVNNNAAAVLLILSAMGCGGEVISSRGELMEIGSSFRIPDIMTQCGCTLKEVGSTNKTHLRGWAVAVDSGKLSVDALEEKLRRREVPIIGRINREQYLLDVRTLFERDFGAIVSAVQRHLHEICD